MKLSEWARANHIHPKTADRWWRQGTLLVPARCRPHDPVEQPQPAAGGGVGLYARVSSYDQRADLDRQVAQLSQRAAAAGWKVVGVEAEVASGVHGRPKLRRLLADSVVTMVVVTHRDRLARINTELVQAALSAHDRRLVVLDTGEVDDDLARDMVEVLTGYCARLYGRRSARNRALKALRCAQRDVGPAGIAAVGEQVIG